MDLTDRTQLESAFLAHQKVIERSAATLCRRHGMVGAEVDDFTSHVRLKLVEDDYAILRRFRGESALATYLTVVIAMIFRDYRHQRWGRWRPSAQAKRRGWLAMRLETLVYRDKLSLREAGEVLRSSDASVTDRRLRELHAALPVRESLRPSEMNPEILEDVASSRSADDHLSRHSNAQSQTKAERAIDAAIGTLPAEDQVILRLRYWEGLAVSDVARALGIPQKPLYRRIDKAQAVLRSRLESAGVSRETVRELLDRESA